MSELESSPKVSIVCVYNDADVLDRCLLNSLRKQDQPYQWVPVDNTNGRFPSASAALNYGCRQSSGIFILYVHQDVVFLNSGSLRSILESLERLGAGLGWAGIAGRDRHGMWRGLLRDRDYVSGEPFAWSQEVQTLDELLLCTRRDEFAYFDEDLSGWHAYGVDACCSALRRGKKNHVVASSIWHASKALNTAKLQEAHEFVRQKHYRHLGPIMTTCGRIPKAYQWKGGYRFAKMIQQFKWHLRLKSLGIRSSDSNVNLLPDLLDELTIKFGRIACLRGKYLFRKMDAQGFRDKTLNPRSVEHFFGEAHLDPHEYDATVLFPDGFSELDSSSRLSLKQFSICIRNMKQLDPRSFPEDTRKQRHYMSETLDGRMYLVSSNV